MGRRRKSLVTHIEAKEAEECRNAYKSSSFSMREAFCILHQEIPITGGPAVSFFSTAPNQDSQHTIIVFLSSGVRDASLGWRLQSMRQSDVLIVDTIRSKDGSTVRKQQKLRSQSSFAREMTVRLPEVRRDEDASNFTMGFQFKALRQSILHPLPC